MPWKEKLRDMDRPAHMVVACLASSGLFRIC